MNVTEHTEYCRLLRQKCEQLGQLAAGMAGRTEREGEVGAVLNLRSDIRRMFDHLGVEPLSKRGRPEVLAIAGEHRHD